MAKGVYKKLHLIDKSLVLFACIFSTCVVIIVLVNEFFSNLVTLIKELVCLSSLSFAV